RYPVGLPPDRRRQGGLVRDADQDRPGKLSSSSRSPPGRFRAPPALVAKKRAPRLARRRALSGSLARSRLRLRLRLDRAGLPARLRGASGRRSRNGHDFRLVTQKISTAIAQAAIIATNRPAVVFMPSRLRPLATNSATRAAMNPSRI